LNKANQLKPNHPFTLQQRGTTKRMLHDFKGSLEDLNKANQLQANNPYTLRQRGAQNSSLLIIKAFKDLDQSNKLKPNNSFTLEQKDAAKQILTNSSDTMTHANKSHNLTEICI